MKVSKSLLFLALSGISGSSMAAEAEKSAPEPMVFVNMAAQSGMAEVALGKMALEKSKDMRVQQFAERMVTDHGKANAELAALAMSKGIEAPKALDAAHEAMVASMKGKEGADFDAAYSKHMNMDHSKAVSLFESEAMSPDRDLAGFARKTLPTLKEHKELAATLPMRKGS